MGSSANQAVRETPAIGVAALRTLGEGPRQDLVYNPLLPAFEAQVARTPTRRAVVCGDAALDYASLDARANRQIGRAHV